MNKQRKKHQWPKVYSRQQLSGNVSYVVDLGLINGKRERFSFKTKTEAVTFAEQKRIERINEGTAALALPLDVRMDAAKAHAILSPHSVSLLDAAKYYQKHVLAYKDAPLVPGLVEKMIAEAEKNDRRDRTIAELKSRLSSFAKDFAKKRLSEITVEELEDWVDDDSWKARTRINYLTKLSQLYNYALRHNWVDANLAERVEKPTAEDKEPGIFTVEQARSLLEHAHSHGLLAYIAIGLFAGLRAAELMGLDWGAVNIGEKSIIIGAQLAKKRSRRVVEIQPVLEAWLNLCARDAGAIVDVENFRENMDQLREAAGITAWPHNGLRHSFGSFHLAAFGDQIKTATQMGHRDSSVVHNHYKALILKSKAVEYWKLLPSAACKSDGKKSRSA